MHGLHQTSFRFCAAEVQLWTASKLVQLVAKIIFPLQQGVTKTAPALNM